MSTFSYHLNTATKASSKKLSLTNNIWCILCIQLLIYGNIRQLQVTIDPSANLRMTYISKPNYSKSSCFSYTSSKKYRFMPIAHQM